MEVILSDDRDRAEWLQIYCALVGTLPVGDPSIVAWPPQIEVGIATSADTLFLEFRKRCEK